MPLREAKPSIANNDADLKGQNFRVEHHDFLEIDDGDSHLWAVSYADFLMVLLSFFVIFFSLNKDQVQEILPQFSNQKKTTSKTLASIDQKFESAIVSNSNTDEKRVLASISDNIKKSDIGLSLHTLLEGDSLMINLPRDIFPTNSIVMNENGKKELSYALDILKEYSNHVQIVFIGHSDSKKVVARKTILINDNFALSSLRATRALAEALKKGFPQENLFSRGDADNVRDSRTLSILVKSRGVK